MARSSGSIDPPGKRFSANVQADATSDGEIR
jgi:hypothetical protein